jgi:hypothetical protein
VGTPRTQTHPPAPCSTHPLHAAPTQSFYILVSTVGYWAYGAAVGGFLLAQSTHPIWLLVLTNLMAVTQLLVGEQVRRRAGVRGGCEGGAGGAQRRAGVAGRQRGQRGPAGGTSPP